jgi:hypothetical protein
MPRELQVAIGKLNVQFVGSRRIKGFSGERDRMNTVVRRIEPIISGCLEGPHERLRHPPGTLAVTPHKLIAVLLVEVLCVGPDSAVPFGAADKRRRRFCGRRGKQLLVGPRGLVRTAPDRPDDCDGHRTVRADPHPHM